MDWSVSGAYLESCNCDAICPCRMVDGVIQGRSTHGICFGLLGWRIDEGHADGIDLAGLGVALALTYSDDEAGSPWTFVLYVDEPERTSNGLRSRRSFSAVAVDRTS